MSPSFRCPMGAWITNIDSRCWFRRSKDGPAG